MYVGRAARAAAETSFAAMLSSDTHTQVWETLPDRPFTILEPKNPLIDGSKLRTIIRQLTDFESLKLLTVRLGLYKLLWPRYRGLVLWQYTMSLAAWAD